MENCRLKTEQIPTLFDFARALATCTYAAYANNATMISTDNVCHPNHRTAAGATPAVRVNGSVACFRWMPKTVFRNFWNFIRSSGGSACNDRVSSLTTDSPDIIVTHFTHISSDIEKPRTMLPKLCLPHTSCYVLHATWFVPTCHIDTRRISSKRVVCTEWRRRWKRRWRRRQGTAKIRRKQSQINNTQPEAKGGKKLSRASKSAAKM